MSRALSASVQGAEELGERNDREAGWWPEAQQGGRAGVGDCGRRGMVLNPRC